ncbi:hypothetical protein A3L12_07350 [Thermococcus sp. P6]|uniref:Eco57I restriction-modification methylase domain-containing protein n=1 Tax=Thermococcus sp. P6 TaxID=122420 RepID=UPI000B59CB33|nr:N-6 DNA methylase [Thermococcus sp. P6]ASJ11126.1 hypothetical protein A3L12_07350 [Thermococcus sp. P6]
MKDIKILDPAVGSGHFLESAIKVLVDIYQNLKDRVKTAGIEKLEILVANDEGRIEPFNLLEIPEKEGMFEIYVKFFIILSRNVYGVDIKPSALKVAKARLFLTLARHFNADAGVFIRFPNVHFNLREGNSLIGYVNLPRKETKDGEEPREKQKSLLSFILKEQEIQDIEKRIKVDEELKEYLPSIAKALGIKGNILREVEEMNRILAKKEIDWRDFERVLKTKEKLTRILVASLNSKYAVKLNGLLNYITHLFNGKLDEKFAGEHGIDLDELKKIKTFHWAFEFPEVMLRENPGFDVVVGNPPYGKIKNMDIPKHEKAIFSKIYKHFYTKIGANIDLYKMFLERSISYVSKSGYYSFLVPIMFWGDKESFELRKLYLNYHIKAILHFPLETTTYLFKKGINYEVSIFILKKANMEKTNYTIYVFPFITTEQVENLNSIVGQRIDKNYIYENSKLLRLPLLRNEKEKEIIEYLKKYKTFGNYIKGEPLGWIFDGKLHETNDKKYLSSKPTGELAVASNHIKDWFVDLEPREEEKRWIKNGDEFRKRKLNKQILSAKTVGELMKISPKLVGRQMANRGEKRKLHFSILFGDYILTNGVRVIILKNDYHKFKYYAILLSLFNSSLLDWRFQKYSLTYNIKPYELEELPIIDLNNPNLNSLVIIAKYMLFLKQYQNYFAKKDKHLQYIIDYFDNLIDCLVYELYLGDVIKIPIRQFVEDKLEDIDLPDNLLETSEKEREELLLNIKKVFDALEKDKKLNENLQLIKLHPWVKAIYTSLGG